MAAAWTGVAVVYPSPVTARTIGSAKLSSVNSMGVDFLRTVAAAVVVRTAGPDHWGSVRPDMRCNCGRERSDRAGEAGYQKDRGGQLTDEV